MATFDLQGEASLLSGKQIQFICRITEKNGINGGKITITALGEAGDNYISNVKSVVAERHDGKTLKMVAKVSPTSEVMRKAMNSENLFRNEFLMYSKVLPKFQELEIDAEIPEEDRFKFPICYGILDEAPHEMMLLEDLRESNYSIKDRFKPLTNEEIRIILDSFAKYHSLSFVLKSKDEAKYKLLASCLSDFFTSSPIDDNVKMTFEMGEEVVISLFDADRYKEKIRGCVNRTLSEAFKIRASDAGSKHSVIIHGDSWTNNVLFKQNSDEGASEVCMLIDYQLSNERCPVSDVLLLLFTSTDYETRSKHYYDWIDEYFDKLDKYLSRHGIKSNYVYPKEKMLADLKRYSKFFLGWSIMMSNILCMDTEDATRMKNSAENSENMEELIGNMVNDEMDNKTEVILRERVKGIIDSFYDLGYCS